MEDILNQLKEKAIINILFVCSGNIIRSVMSQFLFKKRLNERNVNSEKFVVNSGAVLFRNSRLDEKTKKLLLEEGIDREKLETFRPTYLKSKKNKHYLDEANIIIGMTSSHIRLLPKKYRNKAFTLPDMVGESIELSDPFGHDMAPYIESFTKIKPFIEKLIDLFIEYDLVRRKS
jgi:protein-tyrosine phosphatase